MPIAAIQMLPPVASSTAPMAKPRKASRTIHSLDSRSRSPVLSQAPPMAPTPKTPSSAP